MRIPRVSIAGLMAAVAVVALDCFLVVNDLIGSWLLGLALNVGLVRMLRNAGRRRRFWVGFEAIGLVTLLAYIACFELSHKLISDWPFFLFDGLTRDVSPAAVNWIANFVQSSEVRYACFEITLVEISFGVPMLVLALVGGLLVVRLTWRRDPATAVAEVVGPV